MPGSRTAGSQTKYLERLNAERPEGDINDPASLARTLPRNVDAVLHVAGSTNRQCDSSKAMRELGYRAVPLRQMVEESYAWLEQEGCL